MSEKRILILGAGLAGLSTAWHLQKKGINCQLFEKEPEVGGLCRSKNIDGFTFDCDGHLLHFQYSYAFNLIKGLLQDNLVAHQRSAWIYAFDTYIRYPFQANLYGLPPALVKECLVGFIKTLKEGQCANNKDLNFLHWINQTFGRGIARHFMVPYNTKFWTLPPKKLTCDWLDGFIPVPSLGQVIEGTIEESQRQFGYNARFWYPRTGGINQLPLAFSNQLKNTSIKTSVTEIDLVKKEIRLSSGAREGFDYLVSTIPLPEMAYIIKKPSRQLLSLLKKLRWNSIFNLNLGLEGKNLNGQHWIYFPQKEICFFRVGFPHNFSACLAPLDKRSLYAEVSYSKDKPIDKGNIALRIKEDLKKVGLLTQNERICAEDSNDIKYGYPIYDKNYRKTREAILRYLFKNNIVPAGRYGSWRYISMEEAILDGRRAASYILKQCLKKG